MVRTLASLAAAMLLAVPAARAASSGAPPALPQAQLEKLLSAYALIKQQYVGSVDDDRLFDGALTGMLAALDAHSQYLTKDDMRDIDREESGDYVGIGVGIEFDHERLRVNTVTPGSPADKAGLQPGDVVLAVDGTPMSGLSSAEVSRHMHGAAGSAAVLTLASGGQHATRQVKVVRAALHESTVHVHAAAPGLAWIRIEEFGGNTGAELVAALKKLDADGAPRGVILDLRNNPGGTLPSAVAAAGAFLPEGAVVFKARGRDGDAERTVTAEPRYYRPAGAADNAADVLAGLPAWSRSVPLTVLVNGSSASAAELLAAALQDNGRAKLVGTPTFGKGSIQSIVALDADTGVKFTIARYFSPNGHEIQVHGVTPDVAAAPPTGAVGDELPREADLANHLPPVDGAAPATVRTAAESTRHFGAADDRALQAAVALLGAGSGAGGARRAAAP